MRTLFRLILAVFIFAPLFGPARAAQKSATAAKDSLPLEAIAATLTERPTAFGRPIADRAAWDPVAASPAGRAAIAAAAALLTTPMPEQPDELFLQYTTIGNRTNWEGVARVRRPRLSLLAVAECLENKGRFLPELEKTIRTLCAERTWVYPAHDGSLTNFNRKLVTIDLFSSALAWNMATADWLLGDRLSTEIRKLIRAEADWRIFQPYQLMLAGKQSRYWLDNPNNWSAVCLAGVTGAGLALLESRPERARLVKAAMDNSWVFLGGFAPDGYCSEGVGYWNFGFGHYVLLSEAVRLASGGKIDLLARQEAYAPATFGAQIQICGGVYPAFADCTIDAQPDPDLLDLLSRKFGFGLPPRAADSLEAGKGYIFENMMYLFTRPAIQPPAAAKKLDLGLRSWFDRAGILIARPAAGSACRMGVALKGGNNAEHHNHNDVGSYVVVVGGRPVLLDPGAEVYTRRTFSGKRYDSNLLNSFGHPVPKIAGKLQTEGAQSRGVVLKTEFGDARDTLALDITSPYRVKELKSLVRTFVYSREGPGGLSVSDAVEMTEPGGFETALIAMGKWSKTGENTLRIEDGGQAVTVTIDTGGRAFELTSDVIKEDMKFHGPSGETVLPTRLGIRLKDPVKKATVTLKIE